MEAHLREKHNLQPGMGAVAAGSTTILPHLHIFTCLSLSCISFSLTAAAAAQSLANNSSSSTFVSRILIIITTSAALLLVYTFHKFILFIPFVQQMQLPTRHHMQLSEPLTLDQQQSLLLNSGDPLSQSSIAATVAAVSDAMPPITFQQDANGTIIPKIEPGLQSIEGEVGC